MSLTTRSALALAPSIGAIQRGVCALVMAVMAISGSLLLALATSGSATPLGKSWASTRLRPAVGFDYVAAPLLEVTTDGQPLLFGLPQQPSTGAAGLTCFTWRDSAWQTAWDYGHGAGFLSPVAGAFADGGLLWRGVDYLQGQRLAFLFGSLLPGVAAPVIDTIGDVSDLANVYAGAENGAGRWAAVSDQSRLYAFSSHTVGQWLEIPTTAAGDNGIALLALNDSTAIAAWSSGGEGLQWCTLTQTAWGVPANVPSDGMNAYSPHLHPKADGGCWLIWATGTPKIAMSAYTGVWAAPRYVQCTSLPSNYSSAIEVDASRDSASLPALCWGIDDESGGAEVVCAAMPQDSAYASADVIDGSLGGMMPTIAVDADGDAWVAWWKYYEGAYWTHTYTSVTSSSLRVMRTPASTWIRWSLSGAAPNTRWTVLRRSAGSASQEVAHLRAGPTTEMVWEDTAAPAGYAAYSIRRDCVDLRYTYLSPEVVTVPERAPFRIDVSSTVPSRDEVSVVVTGAAANGAVQIAFYDVQGRRVQRIVAYANAEGAAAAQVLWPAWCGSGVYFAQARDGERQRSNAARLVRAR